MNKNVEYTENALKRELRKISKGKAHSKKREDNGLIKPRSSPKQ